MSKPLRGVRWRLCIPPERFAALKTDESFRQILALGRLLNSLRFLEFAFLGVAAHRDPSLRRFRFQQWILARLRSLPFGFLRPKPERPAAMRQRISAFLFIAATLYEGLRLIQNMAKNFRRRAAWQQGMAPILRDRLFERLFAKSLDPLRNGVVFHFFQDAFDEPLQRFASDDIVFISGFGPEQGQTLYDLSDRLALDLFIGDEPTAEAQLKRAEILMIKTRDLLLDIINAGEVLIAEYASEQGFLPVRGAGDKGAA